jgi:hypothetical protein
MPRPPRWPTEESADSVPSQIASRNTTSRPSKRTSITGAIVGCRSVARFFQISSITKARTLACSVAASKTLSS